ncbi:spermatogenesis-associated protein 17 [Hippoglossus hippoglossus]|uniref:spermatogenesis-associated protein 17 n=1 Tax=Hippoglossus hippoglossus TaxID=8267 RepID=UPI00148C3CD6|nr:spermatogenesis-associated protein 17 [Hippoglossus hippoglossus]
MAQLVKVKGEAEEFQRDLFRRISQAEENRQRENQAATRIQSWFRACKVQAYLSHLHKKAIIIQKIWWGFTARARFRQMVKAAYFIMKMNFYDEMAVRIQRRWKGYFVRKYIHNFYARRRYLDGLSRKNELVRRELDELEELQKRERDCLQVVKEQTNRVYQAHRLHHLLSTKQCPGVFNSPFRPAPHETELLLRQVKYQAPTRLVPIGRAGLLGMPDSTAPSFRGSLGSPWIKPTRTGSFKPILPPIANRKQQGLFQQPGEVWDQCVRCPDLTLRLQTSYTQLEEAQKQLQHHKSTTLQGGTLETGRMNHSNDSFTQPACAESFKSQMTH